MTINELNNIQTLKELSDDLGLISLNSIIIDDSNIKQNVEETNRLYRETEILFFNKKIDLLNEKINNGTIIVKDIEVNGVENLLKILKNDLEIVTIFLKVPKEELRKRLEAREDKQSPEEIELRLNRLEYEESKIGMYDYVIKNDDLDRTLRIIEEIIKH